MSSVERERVVGNKREAPGSSSGRRVFDSNKEKKKRRRLILSDSESDDDGIAVSSRNRGVENDSVDDVKVEALVGSEVHQDEPLEKEMNSIDGSNSNGEVKVKAERGSSSEVGKEGEKGSLHGSTGGEEVELESGKGLSLEVAEKRAEDDSAKIESGEHIEEVNDIGRLASEGTRVESETVDCDSPLKECTAEQLTSKEELKVESLTSSSSVVVMKQEEAENIEKARDVSVASRNGRGSMITRKNLLDGLSSKERVKIDEKKVLKPKGGKEGEEVDSRKKPSRFFHADQIGGGSMTKKKTSVNKAADKEEMNVEAKKDLTLKVAMEREEAGSKKKSSGFSWADQNGSIRTTKNKTILDHVSCKEERQVEAKKVLESKFVKERAAFDSKKKSPASSGAGRKGADFFTRKKKNSDVLTSEEEQRLEAERFLNSRAAQEMEESDYVKMRAADSGSDRKRSRETTDDDIVLKKLRSEHAKHRQEQGMKTGEKIMKNKVMKSGDEGSDSKASLDSEPVVSGNIQTDEVEEKSMQDYVKKDEQESENCGWIQRSTARTLRKLRDSSTSLGGARRDDVDISQRKGIRVHSEGSVVRVLPSNKKVGVIEGGHMEREGKDNWKSMTNGSLSNEGQKERTISSFKSVKTQLNAGKVSSVKSAGPGTEKTAGGISSLKLKSKNEDSSNDTTDPIVKGELQSKPEASVMTVLNTNDEASERRSTVKQRVRDMIKGILLDAGWKIDLRPRKGRCYEDAVWIAPTGGSGFWSITKAYKAYLDSNTLSNSSDTYTTFATIPDDLLQMLTRNVVNKRRNSKEIEKAKKKLGVKKKEKGNLKIKGSKNNGGGIVRKDDNEGGKVRKKRNTDVDVICSTARKLHLRVRNKKKRGCTLMVRGANQDTDTDDDEDYVPYAWKRTILSWMIDLGIVRADGKVKYMNKKRTQTLLEGSITRDGIRCGCCSKIVSVSKFEIHAGSKLGHPYQNILVEETGFSLLQCQLNAWAKQQGSEQQDFYKVDIEGDDPNDDTCGLCGDGGDLICCDGCPSTFHLNCLGIQMLPPGDWHCTNCSCRYCGLVSDAVPKGSVSVSSTLLTCSQCEKKYHCGCIPEADAISVCSKNSDTSFCGKSCKKTVTDLLSFKAYFGPSDPYIKLYSKPNIGDVSRFLHITAAHGFGLDMICPTLMVFKRLQKLVGTKNNLEAGLSWCLVRRFCEDSSACPCSLSQKAECNSKIVVAFMVMDECFRPIIDERSGINLIHNVVYNCGSNINRLSYSGFYTFVLERGDEIIAVASVRIHGTKLAEMPFIGTRSMYRRQGMCRQLLNGIESALCSLDVEKLIIPAISELTETWTGVFGFKPLNLSQRQEVSSINMLVFPGTGLLHKPILKKGAVKEHTTLDRGKFGESVTEHEQMNEAVKKYSVCSPGQREICASDADVRPEHRTEGAELLQTTENLVSPTRSEFQTFRCKLPESFVDVNLSVRSKLDQNELTGDDLSDREYSNNPKTKKPCEGTVHENQEADNATSSVALGNNEVADSSLGCSSIIKDHNLLGAANESYVLSVRPGLHSADEVILPPKNESKDGDISVISSMCAVDATSVRHSAEDGVYKCEGAATDVPDVKAPITGVNCGENAMNTEPCILTENEKPFDIPQTLKNESIGSNITNNSCTIIKPDIGIQISYNSSIQENSELLQKPLDCAAVAHSSTVAHPSTDKLNHCDNDSPSTLHLCPVPGMNISSRSEGLLENSPDININAGCTEQKTYSLDENLMQHHIQKMVDESLGVNCESNISSSCGIESYEMQPDDDNQSLLVSEDSAPRVHDDSPSAFADGTFLGTSNVKYESGRVSHGHGSIAMSPKVYSGRPLDKVVVQHGLLEVNGVSDDVCVKPGHCHAEGVLDATTAVSPSSA